jgi:nicotinamide-nucleotide amidase
MSWVGAPRPAPLAAAVASAAKALELRIGCAESLTTGRVASALGAASEASSWFRGAVVAYASEVKFDVLDVPRGPVVTRPAALAMARGAARVLGADVAIGVSGSGGPERQDGRPPGTVCFGLVHPGGEWSEEHLFQGAPADVVEAATDRALALLHQALQRSTTAR